MSGAKEMPRANAAAREAVIAEYLKALKLPAFAGEYRGLVRQARDGGWDYEDFLRELLEVELHSQILERALGRLEGRLELTERAESTLREERERLLEDLARERERAAQEQERAEEIQRDAEQSIREREEAQEETHRLQKERDRLLAEAAEEARVLREELEAERSKGFWRRLFGG